MRVVWKFSIPGTVRAPVGAPVVLVGTQGDQAFVWVQLDPTHPAVERKFVVHGTGYPLKDWESHVGSFQDGSFVRHVYEVQQ